MKLNIYFLLLVVFFTNQLKAQLSIELTDTIIAKHTDSISVFTDLKNTVRYLSDINGVTINAGKKTNLIDVNKLNANLSQVVARQIFAKAPGITFWDMDGAGTQINVGSRGTDSHRSIEMNMRQNGYNTNSDIFGYPENHYTPPMQAIQSIELIRGSAALQYGSQYGGMLNLVMKDPDSTKPIAVTTEQTVGSNNLYNSYTSLSGTKNKLSYFSYFVFYGFHGFSVSNYCL